MSTQTFELLLQKYLNGSLSEADRQELIFHLKHEENQGKLKILMDGQLTASTIIQQDYPEVVERIKSGVLDKIRIPEINWEDQPIKTPAPFYRLTWFKYAAACMLILAGYSVWNLKTNQFKTHSTLIVNHSKDIAPGRERAVLTLANGSTINLDSAANGTIAKEGKTTITKNKTGEINYKPVYGANGATSSAIQYYNTMSTPRGGQYQLTLPDNSRIWLNASSSITYPVAFTGKERKVSITGEVYFEIAHNPKQPFIVKTNREEIRVLGTHFNVNTYGDEQINQTTLLQGSIQLTAGENKLTLIPGQQATTGNNSNLHLITGINTESIIAWKNGRFDFENATLEAIPKQVSRWYDVDLVYNGNIPPEKYFGIVNRNSSLSAVLKALQSTGVQFTIDGKKLIVNPIK